MFGEFVNTDNFGYFYKLPSMAMCDFRERYPKVHLEEYFAFNRSDKKYQ
jgi:hypothetical protein